MGECMLPVLDTGLRGIDVASSRICDVQGQKGKLIYRGFLIEDLAANAGFEEVCFLLLYERLPKAEELDDFTQKLKRKRKVPENIFSFMKTLPSSINPMDVLQMATPLLIQNDHNVFDQKLENTLSSAENLIAGMATILAAWERIRNNKKVIPPDNRLNHASNFLYMLNGKVSDTETADFFNTTLVLHAEHSFNASTFTARQVASTRAHIYAAVSAAIGSLSGALHGGANVRVMKMLKEIEKIENIDTYIKNILNSGGLIMGLGHAVYQTDDPRALILAPMSKKMGKIAEQPGWYALSREIEIRAKKAFKQNKHRDIFCNVDFYSASLLYTMGIPMDFFSPVFAISRISGWAAHVIEEQYAKAAPKPSLYRPGAEYIGDYCGPDECIFTEINER